MTTTLPDIPTFTDDGDSAAPIPFRLAYQTAEGQQTSDFTARGTVPYAWVMDFWDAERLNIPGQSSALLTFFRRCLTDDSQEAFFALVEDPAVGVAKKTLQAIASFLLLRYEGVDPTPARSGGRKRSQPGRSTTGSGSSRSASAKASTSRRSTPTKAQR